MPWTVPTGRIRSSAAETRRSEGKPWPVTSSRAAGGSTSSNRIAEPIVCPINRTCSAGVTSSGPVAAIRCSRSRCRIPVPFAGWSSSTEEEWPRPATVADEWDRFTQVDTYEPGLRGRISRSWSNRGWPPRSSTVNQTTVMPASTAAWPRASAKWLPMPAAARCRFGPLPRERNTHGRRLYVPYRPRALGAAVAGAAAAGLALPPFRGGAHFGAHRLGFAGPARAHELGGAHQQTESEQDQSA